MQHLDLTVVRRALAWLRDGRTLWLATVLSTYGSSPREPGAWLAATRDGDHVGSLSGGCVEEDFLERLGQGDFDRIGKIAGQKGLIRRLGGCCRTGSRRPAPPQLFWLFLRHALSIDDEIPLCAY